MWKPRCKHKDINHECVECAELYDFWESILESEGLGEMDIKMQNGNLPLFDKDQISEDRKNQAIYYSLLHSKVNSEKFENQIHEIIMAKAAEGAKICKIIEALEAKGKYIHRETVRFIIRRYEHKWGIREWTPKQLHLKTLTE